MSKKHTPPGLLSIEKRSEQIAYSKALNEIRKVQRNKSTNLSLSAYGLSRIPKEIRNLPNLRSINLSHNLLTELPKELVHLHQLQDLLLDDNEIKALPIWLTNLSNLTRISLANNRLTSIPNNFSDLTKLVWLDLRGNQLSVPVEILSKCDKPEEILKFVRQLGQDIEIHLNQCKLLIVGEGAVGKTSLVNRLINDSFIVDQTTTNGIAVTGFKLSCKKHGEILTNIWDFGGQEIMHSTHQFFLTKRSVYILVLNLRAGERDNRLEYWLKLIESYGGESPIIVVMNKCDEYSDDLDRRGLLEKYPTIKGFARVSCKTGEGINIVREMITASVDQLPHLDELIPNSWAIVKNWFEMLSETKANMGREDKSFDDLAPQEFSSGQPKFDGYREILRQLAVDTVSMHMSDLDVIRERSRLINAMYQSQHTSIDFVTFSEYLEMCRRAKVRQGDEQLLITFLNDLGIALHYDDLRLRENAILNPRWVTQGVYRILTSKAVKDAGGIFQAEAIESLLPRSYYPFGKQTYIIDIMRKFDLLFDLIPDRVFLVPDLLPIEQPALPPLSSGDQSTLVFQYLYNILPNSLITRFIVRMHNYILANFYWRSGVILQSPSGENRASIIADSEDRKIEIRVSGSVKHRRHLLARIREEFDQIHCGVARLEVTEVVCLPDAPEVTIDYSDLIDLEREGIIEHYYPKAKRKINVPELLSGFRANPHINETKLRSLLVEAFDIDELRIACEDFGVPFNEIRGETMSSKTLDLILYCRRRSKLRDFINFIQTQRSDLDWNQAYEPS